MQQTKKNKKAQWGTHMKEYNFFQTDKKYKVNKYKTIKEEGFFTSLKIHSLLTA